MFPAIDVNDELTRVSRVKCEAGDHLVREAERILHDDRFSGDRILQQLQDYHRTFEFLDEEPGDLPSIYTAEQIQEVSSKYRLKFLASRHYKGLIPADAAESVRRLNVSRRKDLKHFFILSSSESFFNPTATQAILFAETIQGNYYAVCKWGKKLPWSRNLVNLPFRSFESLLLSLICFTLMLTLSLPTWLITLDQSAEYWSGYRAAAFFHLLIFNAGFTAYFMFAFSRNFNSSVWNRLRDFG